MKIELLIIGKNNFSFVDEGVRTYEDRLSRYVKFERRQVPDLKNAAALSVPERRTKEGLLFLSLIEPSDFVVLLDEKGKEHTSKSFAAFLQAKMNSGIKCLKFVVGGPYGFSDELYARANEKISLSKLTFPHDLVRVIFVEQLYRAFTIIKGEKYHHD